MQDSRPTPESTTDEAAPIADDYPVDLTPPDIDCHREGNTGVPYVTSWQASAAGPHVMVTAVVHGNELCGAIVLDELMRVRPVPKRGRLTLAFVNVAAYQSFEAGSPTSSRFVDEDFNRLWSAAILDGPRDSVELRRARALKPVVDTVDVLLDIHSMQHPTAPLTMAGPLAKGRRLAEAVGCTELVVTDAGHAAGQRLRDYAAFADPDSARNALLVECGQHWQRASADVARESLARFLAHLDVIEPTDWPRRPPAPAPARQRFIEVTDVVTIETDAFRFVGDVRGLEVIADAGTVIAHDGEAPVRTPYDGCVLIMPSRRLIKGQTAVRLGRFADTAAASAD